MSENKLSNFLEDLMRRRRILPSQLANKIGVSHATIGRWLSGQDIPNPRSCRKLAEYSGVSSEKILSLAGHLPEMAQSALVEWPEFGEYCREKYPEELDDDLISAIEDLIERRIERRRQF